MSKASKVAGMVLVLCAMTAAGCQKKVQITFFNHTNSVLPVKVTTPEHGTVPVGSIAGNGSQIRYTVRIKTDLLPAQCACAMGLASKTFTITEDTPDRLWFHLTRKGLAGPVDEGTTLIDAEKIIDVKTTIRTDTVVE